MNILCIVLKTKTIFYVKALFPLECIYLGKYVTGFPWTSCYSTN